MIPAADEDLLLLLHFICFRFMGYTPDDKMLLNAISDWRREIKGGTDTDL